MIKYTKRIIPVIILLVLCMCLPSCSTSKNEIVGSEKIEAFRNTASEYSSGRYFITNILNEELEEVYTFCYNEDNTLAYSHEKMRNEIYTCEYSDGYTMMIENQDGVQEITRGNELYALYSKANRHGYADAQILFYVPGFISDANETIDDNGNQIYVYTYDVDKMNQQLGKSLTSFLTVYVFDKDDNFLYFSQQNSSIENNEVYEYAYMIEISQANGITGIDFPTDE